LVSHWKNPCWCRAGVSNIYSIEVSKKEMDSLGMFASILGHIGDGNFHESIMYDKTNPEEVKRIEAAVHNMVDRALEMEGTCTVRSSLTPTNSVGLC